MKRWDVPPEVMALRQKVIQKKTESIMNSMNTMRNNSIIIRKPLPNIHHIRPNISTAGLSYSEHYVVQDIQQPNLIQGDYVTVRLLGGVGNRIFQLLAALGYSEKFQKIPVISRSNISNGAQPHEKNLDDIISKIFPNIHFVDNLQNLTVINERVGFTYNPLGDCLTNILLTGYFQNEKYFPSNSLIPILKTNSYANTYFMHIRAGDYLVSPALNHNLSIYYSNCINILGPNVKYLVFSNDNEYARKYLTNFNIEYTLSDKTDQLEILVEMANCEGAICANSSFSWLGAFFQDKSIGKRFMPSIWMKRTDCSGVYPTWATIIDTYIRNIPQHNLYDIVIPVGPSDYDIINKQIEYTKRNIEAYRNIYIISTNEIPFIEGCIMIDENIFPFTLKIVEESHGKNKRNGWYLQQLLKLYAGRVIPDILNTYLVIDCDTFFLKPTRFMLNNKCLYNYGSEYNIPYFEHMSRLHSSFKKVNARISGICHHMIFQTKYLEEIFNLVEVSHSMPFYQVFLDKVTETSGSGASEYELYFNYMMQAHPDKIDIRKLFWKDVNKLTNSSINDYESAHWYDRK
jgi:hypothetical protein